MGERTSVLKPADGQPGASGRLAREIDDIRGEIAALVDELDRRRRELFDVRLQMQRHPVAVSVAGLTLGALLGGAVALVVYNARRKRRTTYKAKQLRTAFDRMMEHPERVARGEPPPGEKIIAAVGTALATLLVRRAFDRATPPPREHAQARARAHDGREARA
jgi:hypothetical protein